MSEHPLDPIFHPRAVAVVGVRSNPDAGMMGSFYDSLVEAGFTRFQMHDFEDPANMYYEVRH